VVASRLPEAVLHLAIGGKDVFEVGEGVLTVALAGHDQRVEDGLVNK